MPTMKNRLDEEIAQRIRDKNAAPRESSFDKDKRERSEQVKPTKEKLAPKEAPKPTSVSGIDRMIEKMGG